jgi:glycosyltransferase involved in cell wall biosynthesis
MGIMRSMKHNIGYHLLNSMVDLVLSVSEEVRHFCIRTDGVPPANTATLYNGLELSTIDKQTSSQNFRALLNAEHSTQIIATVGHVRLVKGIDVLVETAAIVARQVPNVLFVVIGRNSNSEYMRQINNRIGELGLSSTVRFCGESEEVFSLLRQCDVFFLPSRSEGFSNALIEAMACSLPCVATNVGGNAEAIAQGENGYIVDNEDASSAAVRIIELIKDPESARKMGRAGRMIVERRFTSAIMIEQLIAHYERLLAAGRN